MQSPQSTPWLSTINHLGSPYTAPHQISTAQIRIHSCVYVKEKLINEKLWVEIESARRMLSNRLTYAAFAKKNNTLTPAYIKYWNCWVFLYVLHVLIYCKWAYFTSCIYPYLSNNFQTPGLLSFGLIFEETLETYKRKKKRPKTNTKSNVLSLLLSVETFLWAV